MTSNLLVFIFFALFLLFLVESIYFLKKKLSVGVVEITNPENQQKGSKFIFIGGLLIVLLIVITSFIFFFSKQQTSPSSRPKDDQPLAETISKIPTKTSPSPTPVQVVYNLPTAAPILSSPTPTLFSKISPTKVLIPTKTPIPTRTPTPTKLPTPIPTVQVTVTPTSPSKTPSIGGPETIISPTVTATPTTALVIVPKLPVAGSVQQTLIMLLVAISSIAAGLIL